MLRRLSGRGIEPLSIVIDVKALRAALDPVRKHNTVINLTIEGGAQVQTLHALVKEYQIDPVRRDIRHVDLIAVDPNKEVTSTVPLEFTASRRARSMAARSHRAPQPRSSREAVGHPVKLPVGHALEIGDVIQVVDRATHGVTRSRAAISRS